MSNKSQPIPHSSSIKLVHLLRTSSHQACMRLKIMRCKWTKSKSMGTMVQIWINKVHSLMSKTSMTSHKPNKTIVCSLHSRWTTIWCSKITQWMWVEVELKTKTYRNWLGNSKRTRTSPKLEWPLISIEVRVPSLPWVHTWWRKAKLVRHNSRLWYSRDRRISRRFSVWSRN